MKIRTTKQELQRIIREEKRALLLEVSMSEIQNLNGKEVSMRYRKATGEVKTYFGRIVASPKAGPGKFFMGVLNQGLKLFKVSGVTAISPASLREEFKEYFDEMCSEEECAKFMEGGPGSGIKGHKAGQQGSWYSVTPYYARDTAKDLKNLGVDATAHRKKQTVTYPAHQQPKVTKYMRKYDPSYGKENEVAPSGWEGTVKHMKRHSDVSNPWALANWMKSKGYKSHHFASGKHKADYSKHEDVQRTQKMNMLRDVFGESAEPDDAELINKAPGQGAKDWYEESNCPDCNGKGCPECNWVGSDKQDSRGNPRIKENLSPELQRFVASLEKKYGHDFIDKSTPEERSHYMKLAKIPGSGSAIDPKKKRVTEGHGDCPHCYGTGEDLDTGEPCSYCHGTGEKIGQEIKETPVPGEFVTANVQKVKKCPTCEGQPDLKIGCPTCGGTGRIKPQDKYMNEAVSYLAFFNGKQLEIHDASSLYDAKLKAIERLKVPKAKTGLLSVMPAEKDGKPIVHTPTFERRRIR